MAFESSFKAIDNTLHHDDGCSTALDYVEQSSWVLFLKYLDDLEQTREQSAELEGKDYERIISGEYQWHEWAMPNDQRDRSLIFFHKNLRITLFICIFAAFL